MLLRFLLPVTAVFAAAVVTPAAAQWRNYDGYDIQPPSAGYRQAAPYGGSYENDYDYAPHTSRGRAVYADPNRDDPSYGGGYDQGAYGQSGGPRGDGELNAASQERTGTIVSDPTGQAPGTIVVDTQSKHLFLVMADGSAMSYGIGVGRQGFSWKGQARVERKAEWPAWYPPKEMIKRRPDLPEHMEGGLDNPLGARALYLYQGNKDTLFRIHGTNEPDTIGKAVSSGCIRMMNADVIDLYKRVPVGTKVVVI